MVALATHTAMAVATERERKTLETLLSTPLTNAEFLRQKLLGYLEAVSPLGVVLAVAFVLGMLDGLLSLAAAVVLAAAVTGQAVFAIVAGMYYSLVCPTVFRARMAALAALGLSVLLHGLVYLVIAPRGTTPAWFLGGLASLDFLWPNHTVSPKDAEWRLLMGWPRSWSIPSWPRCCGGECVPASAP
jgi:hypothetical protein